MDVAKGTHVSAGPFQHLICANWLSIKLSAILDIVFFTCLWYFFFNFRINVSMWSSFGFFRNVPKVHKSQRTFNLNFQILKFAPLNLLLIIASTTSSDVMLCLKIGFMFFINSNQPFPSYYVHSKASKPSIDPLKLKELLALQLTQVKSSCSQSTQVGSSWT